MGAKNPPKSPAPKPDTMNATKKVGIEDLMEMKLKDIVEGSFQPVYLE